MLPIWYIQQIKHDGDTWNKMVFAAGELGIEVVCKPYIPFSEDFFADIPRDRPVVFLGSINAVKAHDRLSKQGKGLYPFAWCDWKLLSCSTYYARYGDYIAQRRYAFYPLAEVKRLRGQIWDDFGVGGKVFLRPDTNDKAFIGAVVHEKNFDAWWQQATWESPPAELMTVVSQPVNILAEDRVVVADGKAVAASQYKLDGCIDLDPGHRPGSMAFAEEVAACWSPHAVFVVDVALTDEGFKVMEIGSVNVAGFYGADVRPICKAMTDIAVREWNEAYGEVPY